MTLKRHPKKEMKKERKIGAENSNFVIYLKVFLSGMQWQKLLEMNDLTAF
mgnify:CR=1 FL=1